MMDRLTDTLIELVGISSTSGHEDQVRTYLAQRLAQLGLSSQVDIAGNLIALLPGKGQPLLLNAHMDRVPPGRGHHPILRDGILYSDGTTNLGADDVAGISSILELLTRLKEQNQPHPPLLIVFTVQEEVGMAGAAAFDPTPWHVSEGIVFDNAFEAGVVVSQGVAYEAFDVQITGRTGHPGKDLSHTVDVIELFRHIPYPYGSLNNDQTRILVGRIVAGSARNAVPATLTLEGELRSFEPRTQVLDYMKSIRESFEQTAHQFGGQVEVRFTTHTMGYAISNDEPLLVAYRDVLSKRGAEMQLRPTFIGSDASSFRPSVKAFTISTGVVNEHSTEEYVAVTPLEQVVEDVLEVLRLW